MKKKVAKKNRKRRRIKKVKERVPSGIGGFNELIAGGFEKSSVNLVVGDSGSGKTIFAMQFLVDGLKRGETCLYITFEEKKNEFYSNMMNFGWDLAEYEKSGKFFFLEYHPEKVKAMIEEGGGEIENIVIKNKIGRVVIDSISSFALLFEEELEKREAALSLFDIIRRWGCTSILTLQEDPRARIGESSSIEFEADSIVLIYYIRYKKERKRFVEVLKMRGTNHSTQIHPLDITNSGIKILKRVFSDGIR